jgi:hypothetical protein
LPTAPLTASQVSFTRRRLICCVARRIARSFPLSSTCP